MVNAVQIQQNDIDDAAVVTTIVGHPNIADYRIWGLNITNVAPNEGTYGTIDVSGGKGSMLLIDHYAPVLEKPLSYAIITAEIDPTDTVSLKTDSVNDIYLWANMTEPDQPEIVAIDPSTESPPQSEDPHTDENGDNYVYRDSLKIAEIRPQAQQGDDPPQVVPFNEYPEGFYEYLETEDLVLNRSITWPDGETTTGSPLTRGQRINSYNEYYHKNVEEPPPGTVHKSYLSDLADYATEADQAGYADQAGHSNSSDTSTETQYITYDGNRYDFQEIIDTAGAGYSEYGKPLAYYQIDDLSQDFDFRFKFDRDWEKIRIVTQSENHNADGQGDSLAIQINNSTRRNYTNSHFDFDYFGNPTEEDESGTTRQPQFSVYYGKKQWWRVSRVPGQESAIADYSLSIANTANSVSQNYPILVRNSHAVSPDVENSTIHGNLRETGHDSINRVRVFEPYPGDVTGKVAIFGSNPFSDPDFPNTTIIN